LPRHLRKASLERLLARRPESVFINPFERGEIGPDLLRAACQMGLEGLVSKRRDRPYQAGMSQRRLQRPAQGRYSRPNGEGENRRKACLRLCRGLMFCVHVC
jgi:bifunctional non-homologous end joining protein LigD